MRVLCIFNSRHVLEDVAGMHVYFSTSLWDNKLSNRHQNTDAEMAPHPDHRQEFSVQGRATGGIENDPKIPEEQLHRQNHGLARQERCCARECLLDVIIRLFYDFFGDLLYAQKCPPPRTGNYAAQSACGKSSIRWSLSVRLNRVCLTIWSDLIGRAKRKKTEHIDIDDAEQQKEREGAC